MSVFGKNSLRLITFFLCTGMILLTLQSCSLIRIESAQEPLAVKDLNTRLLTQEFVGQAMDLTQRAADSILKENPPEETKKMLLLWQINTAGQLKELAFQASPQVALLDVWTYMLKTKYFFEDQEIVNLSFQTANIIEDATSKNASKIERIANKVLNKKEFQKYAVFVEEQARTAPFRSTNFEKITSVREAYLEMTNTPDSLSVKTVGTLSEVVSDLGNRISYGTELTRKQLKWETQLYLKEKGLDTVNVEEKFEEFQTQIDRLIVVAENSPELLDSALVNFRNQIDPIFMGLERGVSSSVLRLSAELAAVDFMVERERIALDSLIKRERLALTEEAHIIVTEGVENTMAEVRKTIGTLTIFAIIFLIVLLGLPFYAGYLLGKRKQTPK